MSHKPLKSTSTVPVDHPFDHQKPPQPRIAFLLHALRANLPAQLTPWRQKQEAPKVVIYQKLSMASIQCAVLVIPLTIAIIVVRINLRTTYYNYPPSSTVALQFAAKLSEIMMQMSLGTVLLETVRRMYLGSQSLPLGGLFAPVQVTNISYLWSLEFWATITSDSLRLRHKLLASSLIVIVFALAALVGPSGAVLMIPRTITQTFSPSTLVLDNATSVFPLILDTSILSSSNISRLERRLDAAMHAAKVSNSFSMVDGVINATDRFNIYSPMVYANSATAYLATMPSFSVVKGMSAMNRQAGARIYSHAPQPLLRTTCYDNTWWSDERPDTDFVNFGPHEPELNNLTTIADVVRRAQSLSPESRAWDPLGASSFYAIAPPSSYKNHSMLLITGGRLVTPVPEFAGNHTNGSVITTCTVDAAWILGDLLVNNGSMIIENTNSDDMLRDSSVWQDPRRIITIQPDIISQFYDIVNKTAFEEWVTYPVMGSSISRSMTYALLLSLANSHDPGQLMATSLNINGKVSDLLTNKTFADTAGGFRLLSDFTWTDPSTLTYINVYTTQDWFGYNATGIPVILSLTVIITYSVVIAAYIISIFYSDVSGSSWDSVGELFMLALNSDRPTHLKHTSVGVRTLSTYREPINLKVSDRDNSVEVVFLNSKHDVNDETTNLHQRVTYNAAY